MLVNQYLEFDDELKKIEIVNKINIDSYIKDNYEMRKEVGKGISRKSPWRPLASIPTVVLQNDLDGIAFLNAVPGTKEERIALQNFLDKHPYYRTSEGKF